MCRRTWCCHISQKANSNAYSKIGARRILVTTCTTRVDVCPRRRLLCWWMRCATVIDRKSRLTQTGMSAIGRLQSFKMMLVRGLPSKDGELEETTLSRLEVWEESNLEKSTLSEAKNQIGLLRSAPASTRS